ncbi:hypothetical protein Vid5_gp44 [Pantoea phage vB_PagS_Vid5]|uniref:Uncharacterized protein n=1 Tax=Pantoea phage vB_PagS_Vid5 TaxID=2099652 RepID=A0A2P1CKR8_9CAUD|nr:hypothetical protein FDJ45_gp044 [Pantoea phage vB_PagS_Vid5]AVJ51799.1 hypothetical protein Vid5_gp44 [Pantoea phage vB_PagS_Vid5]
MHLNIKRAIVGALTFYSNRRHAMYYEYIVHNHTKLIDLDNISWIDLQVNDVGMHSKSCVVYTNHGTVLTLHNEDATDFVKHYKAYKEKRAEIVQHVSGELNKEAVRDTINKMRARHGLPNAGGY